MGSSVRVDWTIVQYQATSTAGKYALSLSEIGIGYRLLNKQRSKTDNIILAFLRPSDTPIRDGMVKATPEQQIKLNEYTSN